jgi:molybdopterin-biosynthesis enzyme MoeA-like protein
VVCLDTRRHTMVIVTDTRITEQDMLEASIEIISVGNELLSGTIANTNAQWISAQITKAGGIVKRITTLGDWDREISSAIKESIQR